MDLHGLLTVPEFGGDLVAKKDEGPRFKDEGTKRLLPGRPGGPQEPTRRARAGVQFGPPSAKPQVVEDVRVGKKKAMAKAPREKIVCDPKLVSAAHERRDRYLEQVNGGHPLPSAQGKYDVSRALPHPAEPAPALPAPLAA